MLKVVRRDVNNQDNKNLKGQHIMFLFTLTHANLNLKDYSMITGS